MDADEIAADRSTAAERVPVEGAYNITEVGDSALIGWWEHGNRVIRWRNLRWWALGLAVVAFPVWLVLYAPGRIMVVVFIAAVGAFVTARAVAFWVRVADQWASVQVKRKQTRAGRVR